VLNPLASPETGQVPASSPILPQEEDMHKGFDNDDGWIMVEDEFLSTAHMFTARLHREEYHRRQEFSKVHGSSRSQTFPVDKGVTKQSGLTKAKLIQADLRKRRKTALVNDLGVVRVQDMDLDDDDAEDGYNLDPKLSELMAEKTEDRAILKPLASSPIKRHDKVKARRGNEPYDVNNDTMMSSDLDDTELEASPLAKHSVKLSTSNTLATSMKDRETTLKKGLIGLDATGDSIAPLPVQKRASMNPKIQQLIAKRKAQAAAGESSSQGPC
jgi:hypothetical protein